MKSRKRDVKRAIPQSAPLTAPFTQGSHKRSKDRTRQNRQDRSLEYIVKLRGLQIDKAEKEKAN